MALTKVATKDTNSTTNYPKQYWWLVLVVVPIVIALIQYQPWSARAGSGNPTSITVGDVSIIVNEAAKVDAALNDALVNQLKQAVERSQQGQHAAAVAALEQVKASSDKVAALPSLLISLADEYRLAGREDDARQTYQTLLKTDSTNERAVEGLAGLPDAPLDGLSLVNFTSQSQSFFGGWASSTVDGNPDTAWASRDRQFPQTFIFALPMQSAISEVSFNNPAYGDPSRGAKDIEISVSAQSATSGFTVAATAALAKNEIGQGIRLKTAPVGRWIKVRILSNYGSQEVTSLGDVSVMGKVTPR